MIAQQALVLRFMRKTTQFIIPIYQRNYAWTKDNCDELWDDIFRAGQSESSLPHFIGSIVYTDAGLDLAAHEDPALIIDGQQRLTTLTLLITALAEALEDVDASRMPNGLTARKLRNQFLVNPDEPGDLKHKLLLSHSDKDTLIAIVSGNTPPERQSSRISEAYQFFRTKVGSHRAELVRVWRGLSRLMIVEISLDRTQNNPQLVFESLNSKGVRLSQADLIRNYVLMGMSFKEQKRLFDKYWWPMERDFGSEAHQKHFDAFMRHFLALRTEAFPTKKDVYKAFKRYVPGADHGTECIESLLADIRINAAYYRRIVLQDEPDQDLRAAFQEIKELKVDPAIPLLMRLYAYYAESRLVKADLLRCIRVIESYVLRRLTCGLSGKSYKAWLVEIIKEIDPEKPADSLETAFVDLPYWRRFPENEEFEQRLQEKDIDSFRVQKYLLRKLAMHRQPKSLNFEQLRTEKVMPVGDLSDAWQRELGPDWPRIQSKYGNTIGNITLVSYNSSYSDKAFQQKQVLIGGFKDGPAMLNMDLCATTRWNEEAICKRAGWLAALASEVWARPQLQAQPDSSNYHGDAKE